MYRYTSVFLKFLENPGALFKISFQASRSFRRYRWIYLHILFLWLGGFLVPVCFDLQLVWKRCALSDSPLPPRLLARWSSLEVFLLVCVALLGWDIPGWKAFNYIKSIRADSRSHCLNWHKQDPRTKEPISQQTNVMCLTRRSFWHDAECRISKDTFVPPKRDFP